MAQTFLPSLSSAGRKKQPHSLKGGEAAFSPLVAGRFKHRWTDVCVLNLLISFPIHVIILFKEEMSRKLVETKGGGTFSVD